MNSILRAAALWLCSLLLAAHASAQTWSNWHGDAANTGFINVDTAPAQNPKVFFLGAIAPGVGPVIGPDGTIYVGLQQGELVALTPDLALKWRRSTQGNILSAPVIAADGSIYVVASSIVRDHRNGENHVIYTPKLHKFTPGGGLLYVQALPTGPGGQTGFTNSPLNIWRAGEGQDVIMLSLRYPAPGGYNVNLLAIPDGGGPIANLQVAYFHPAISSSSGLHLTCEGTIIPCPSPSWRPPAGSTLPENAAPPMPGVALYSVNGGAPFVTFADGFQTILGFSYSVASGFHEEFRRQVTNDDANLVLTTPVMLADGHSVVRAFTRPEYDHEDHVVRDAQAWVLYAGPSHVSVGDYHFGPDAIGPGSSVAVTSDGRLVTTTLYSIVGFGGMEVLRNFGHDASVGTGESMAPPAISRNHIFVSTPSRLLTFDAQTLALVNSFDWIAGGVSPPAIAGDGRVYAMASRSIYGFSAPTCVGRRCRQDQLRDPHAPAAVTH